MKNLLSAFIFTALAAIFLIAACDEPTQVGRDLIPPDDVIVTDSSDTFSVIVNLVHDDSIITSNRSTPLLGAIESPVFGNAYASLYTELGRVNKFETGTFTYDSLMLYVAISSFTGDTTSVQNFNVYRMTDSIRSSSITNGIRSDSSITTSTLVGTISVDPKTDSTFILGKYRKTPHFKARLDDNLGAELFQKLTDGTIDHADSTLQANLRGLYIEPVMNTGTRGTFTTSLAENGSTIFTGLHLYYHNASDSNVFRMNFIPRRGFTAIKRDADGKVEKNSNGDTLYTFLPGVQNLNRMVTDYTAAESVLQTSLGTYANTGYSSGYVQGGNGLLAQIEFPDVAATLAGKYVNRAQLIVEGTYTDPLDSLFLPTSLILGEYFDRNDLGEKTGIIVSTTANNGIRLPDRLYDLTDRAVLEIDSDVTPAKYTYTFNLPLYVQNIIKGEVPAQVYLSVPNRTSSFEQVKFGGTNAPQNRIRLKVFYSDNP